LFDWGYLLIDLGQGLDEPSSMRWGKHVNDESSTTVLTPIPLHRAKTPNVVVTRLMVEADC